MGCGDLLPGERVLGDEVPAVILDGSAGSRLGAAVAVGLLDEQVAVAVAAPDAGTVTVHDPDGRQRWQVQGEVGLGLGLTIAGGRLLALLPGQGVVDLTQGGASLLLEAPRAAQLAACPDGALLTADHPDEAVACGPDGQALRTRCDGAATCQVLLDEVPLATTSAGSDVAFWGPLACWGDALPDQDDAAGAVRCEDGSALDGLQGEHLGRSLADGWATGVFDKWIVPARARIHPMGGGEVWAVDRAAEATRLALATGEGLLVVGVPGYAARDPGEGRVFIVDLAEHDAVPAAGEGSAR